ncbi:MAG: hemerythrin domain-containing protein [Dokdonella sp.]
MATGKLFFAYMRAALVVDHLSDFVNCWCAALSDSSARHFLTKLRSIRARGGADVKNSGTFIATPARSCRRFFVRGHHVEVPKAESFNNQPDVRPASEASSQKFKRLTASLHAPVTDWSKTMGSILTTLKSEHKELKGLFDQINDTTDRASKARTSLLKKIEAALVPHAKWEELFFYPAFAARADHEELGQHAEAIQEHRAVELTVLPDIHACDPGSRQFAGCTKVLAEFVTHHAKEEEKSMFSSAKKLFSAEELAAFDEHYAKWKKSADCKAVMAEAKAKTEAAAQGRDPTAPG